MTGFVQFIPYNKIAKLICFVFFALSVDVFADDLINKITINGLQRIELGTVLSYMPVKSGESFNIQVSDNVIHTLYDTGFFDKITVNYESKTLIVSLAERPTIAKLTITGDSLFDHDKVLQSLKDNGLALSLAFDQSTLSSAILALKNEYYNQGLYSVDIKTEIKTLLRNRVNLALVINEGEHAKIADIQFIGNKNFTDKQLSSNMFLSTGSLLSFWRKNNQYSNDKLGGDLEKIKAFYQNQGYINYKLKSVQIQISTDKLSVYLIINIDEGYQYRLNTVEITGNYQDIPKEKLTSLLTFKKNQIVNQSSLDKVIQNIKNTAANYGYAFATVNAIPETNEKNHTVSYKLFLDLSKKIYVRNINVIGNEKTRDVVVRRELRQEEMSLYNYSAIQRSKDRLNMLGYFKTVDIQTNQVPDSNNQVDLDIKLTENSTGNASFGLGYAQGQGLLISGGFNKSNIFGSGKSAAINASISQLNSNLSLSFTDPYYLINGTSIGYDIYYNIYKPDDADISPYETKTLGAKVRTSVPVSEVDRVNFSLGIENNQIEINNNTAPLRFIEFTNQYGDSVNALPFTASWSRNTSDNLLWPTKGANYSQTATVSLPLVGAQYYKFDSLDAWYIPINDDLTWKINTEVAFINPYGNGQTVPFYQNFFEGGPYSIRGYYIGSLGPKDTDGASLGGTRWALLSNNLMLPMPGVKEAHTVRVSGFYDIGTLYGGNSFDLTAEQMIRASYGLELMWFSPLGPIEVSYAIPMFSQSTDNIQRFQFTIGAKF